MIVDVFAPKKTAIASESADDAAANEEAIARAACAHMRRARELEIAGRFAEAEVEYRATLALAPTWREAAIRAELTLARRTLECRCENCVAMRASAARAGGAALKRPPSSHSVVSSTA